MKSWIYPAVCTLIAATIAGCGGSTTETQATPEAQDTVAALPTTESGLYEAAQQAERDGRPQEAISLYRKILADYPESENSYKAQFLIGFVFSEDMNEPDSARVAFEAVLANYPNSEFADDAEAMLGFINGEMPVFQDSPPQ